MNRTQQKCLLASAALHLLLLALLVVGPGFRRSERFEESRPLIDFVPLKTIDEALAGGGSPQAPPPQPVAPPPPAPQPPASRPVAQPSPAPAPKPVRDPESFEIKPATRPPRDIQLNPVVRKPESSRPAPSAIRDRRAELAQAAQAAAQRLQQSLSTATTTVELRGPGGGGVPYANFLDAVKKVYSDAWVVPDGLTDEEATATASVTIARDGTVVSAQLIRSSGNPLLDASVESVLRRVRYVVPLPENAREDQRTVTIRFNLKAKRSFG